MTISLIILSLISMSDFSNSDKEALVGHVQQVRGFTQRTDKGVWLLSSEPKLNSCCKGTAKKASSQILLPECTFERENSLVVMEGTLVASTDEQEIRHYALTEAKQIRKQTSVIAFSILAGLILAVGYLFWRRFAGTR